MAPASGLPTVANKGVRLGFENTPESQSETIGLRAVMHAIPELSHNRSLSLYVFINLRFRINRARRYPLNLYLRVTI